MLYILHRLTHSITTCVTKNCILYKSKMWNIVPLKCTCLLKKKQNKLAIVSLFSKAASGTLSGGSCLTEGTEESCSASGSCTESAVLSAWNSNLNKKVSSFSIQLKDQNKFLRLMQTLHQGQHCQFQLHYPFRYLLCKTTRVMWRQMCMILTKDKSFCSLPKPVAGIKAPGWAKPPCCNPAGCANPPCWYPAGWANPPCWYPGWANPPW